jgi:hypothetical protein
MRKRAHPPIQERLVGKTFLPSALVLIRGQIALQRQEEKGYVLVVHNKSGLYYCYFPQDPHLGSGLQVHIMAHAMSVDGGKANYFWGCVPVPKSRFDKIRTYIKRSLPKNTVADRN